MKNYVLLSLVLFSSLVVCAQQTVRGLLTQLGTNTPLPGISVTVKGTGNATATSADGRRWDGLNGDEPLLVSKLGEKGVRDPYILRAHEGGKFYLLATDLSINLNRDWGRSQRAGSKSIVIWESTDLVKWSEPRLVQV
ncbi:MAG: 1,4-beta-xylanase, partial [Bacteroidota bacterium]